MGKYILQDEIGMYLEKLEVKKIGDCTCWGTDWTADPQKAIPLHLEETLPVIHFIRTFDEYRANRLKIHKC